MWQLRGLAYWEQEEMILTLVRKQEHGDATVGELYLDAQFVCCTLEDIFRGTKVAGKTRIPTGVYPVQYRKEGGFYKKYTDRFPGKFGLPDHPILWIKNIPGFEYVYFHIGNTANDTEGCVLVGKKTEIVGENFYLQSSTDAYLNLYEKLLPIGTGEICTLVVLDSDRRKN